jgi:predicted alpha/beta-fold hydrolase
LVTQADTLVQAQTALPAWLTSFEPHPWLANGHLQTIVGNFLPRPAFDLPDVAETVEVDPADGSRVLCHCHWQPEPVRAARLTTILVHGLNGSSNSRYIRGVAQRAWDAGMNVVRMNMRNCGGSDALSPALFHSGRSEDVGAVVRHFTQRFGLERVALVGYSMGGNMVLKLAGEWGARPPLVAVATVCSVIDLAACSNALHAPSNFVYERHFLHALMQRFRHKAELFPAIYQTRGIGPVRSIREFDQKIVAPNCGFRDADDYYYRAASARVIDRIAVPALVLLAQDDPFIRLTPETREQVLANPHIDFIEPRHGGHCAFLSRRTRNGAQTGDRVDSVSGVRAGNGVRAGDGVHWAEAMVVRYLQAVT